MRYLDLVMLTTIFLTIFSLTSCNQPNQSNNKESISIEKADQLTQKEQELHHKRVDSISNHQTVKQQTENPILEKIEFLNKFDKKYSYEVKLLDNVIIKKRLKKMLGSQYDFMKSIWQVETPIKITNGLLYTWGMEAHSGGDPSAVFMADISNNILYVGIRKDGQEKVYSEDGSNVSQQLQDWANEQ